MWSRAFRLCTGLSLAGFCGVRISVPLFYVSLFARNSHSEGDLIIVNGASWFTILMCVVMIAECVLDLIPLFDSRQRNIAGFVLTILAGGIVCTPPVAPARQQALLFIVGGLLALVSHLAERFFRYTMENQIDVGPCVGCFISLTEDVLTLTLAPAVLYSPRAAGAVVVMVVLLVLFAFLQAANFPLQFRRSPTWGALKQVDDNGPIGYHVLSFGGRAGRADTEGRAQTFPSEASQWTFASWMHSRDRAKRLQMSARSISSLTSVSRKEAVQNIMQSLNVIKGQPLRSNTQHEVPKVEQDAAAPTAPLLVQPAPVAGARA